MNEVLKDKNGNILNPKIPRYEYNLYTNEEPVKTGRKINGKNEYVKRVSIPQLPNNSSLEIGTGLNINEIKVIDLKGLAYRSSDNTYIPLPFISMAGINIGLNTKVIDNILNILIETSSDRTNFTGWAEVSFIYN